MSKHTSVTTMNMGLPLKAVMEYGFPCIVDSSGERIADIICPLELRVTTEGTQLLGDRTRLIVTACNSFDALVEALKQSVALVEAIARQHPDALWLGGEYAQMKAALSLAQQGTT